MRSPIPVPAASLVFLALALGGALAATAQDPPPRRVLLLGIDGADAQVFEDLRAAGKLPTFDALAARGCYGRLATTNPAQSPVSWASMLTASNPGKTGILDFLRRNPDSPGHIGLATAEKTTVPGPLGGGVRVGVLAGVALSAALVVGGLVLLVLMLAARGAPPARRRLAAAVVGLVAGGAAAFLAHGALRRVPDRLPSAISLRQGVPLWSVLGAAGVGTVALEAPVSFPADRAENLHLLTGLGTPDVQGHWGHYAVFTEDAREVVEPETGGFVDALVFDESGTARSRVYGPPNPALTAEEKAEIEKEARFQREFFKGRTGVPSQNRFEERVAAHASRSHQASCVLEFRRDAEARTVTVRVGAGGPRPVLDCAFPKEGPGPAAALPSPRDDSVRWGDPVVLKEREWSAYVPFEFEMFSLLGARKSVRGIAQFWLESAGGGGKPARVLLAPVSFDPREVPPNVEVSWPRGFAPSLAAAAGPFSLVGWPCLTNPVKDGMLSDEAFLAQVRRVLAERKAKLAAALKRDDWRFLFVMFSEVDRVQHAFWRHLDPKSPLHDPAAAKVYAPAVEEFYVAMDRVLADMVAAAGKDDVVLVMSDHGFAPYNRSVSLNTWLRKAGFLVGDFGDDRGVNQIFTGRDMFERINWADTKAYAVGLGGIFLNLQGRERDGSVAPGDADRVAQEIRRRLLALRDDDGARVVREVYLGKDLYSGPAAARFAPDLVVGFERGYRVSWQTTLGGGAAEVIEDNRFPWSGDHCSVDPSLVPGILLSSRPLRTEGASVMDLAPTILDWFGVPRPEGWDGKSLLAK
ncbi:MAG TPA: alkaline phosphatase family protein [Planctomycetota bacterium]|nr:alkaline phosphatase family protein [Planctomycetota bacterium]